MKYALNLVVGPVGLHATPWPVGIPGLSLPAPLPGWGGLRGDGGGSVGTPFPPSTQGRTHRHVREPDPSELLHLIFTALSFVSAPKSRSQPPTQG